MTGSLIYICVQRDNPVYICCKHLKETGWTHPGQ